MQWCQRAVQQEKSVRTFNCIEVEEEEVHILFYFLK